MTHQVHALVLAGNGINCEIETAHACRLAGADHVDIVYLWDLASGKVNLQSYNLLCLPGGFLDGDDLGSARASTIRIHNTPIGDEVLFDQFKQFVENGGLAIGICNGFQLMVKLGLLPALNNDLGNQQVTLTWNDSGRFEDRWVELAIDPESPCVFTRGMGTIALPVRHGEGKFVAPDKTREALHAAHQVPLCYVDPASGEATTDYPANPNGSPDGIAGLTDSTIPRPSTVTMASTAFARMASSWASRRVDSSGTSPFMAVF